MLNIAKVLGQIDAACVESREVLVIQFRHRHAAVKFQRAYGRDQHHSVGLEPGHAALDVDKLLGAEICAEACFGHHIVGKLEGRAGRGYRIAAVGNIGERPAVHEGDVVLQGLHNIRTDGVLQQGGHCAMGFQIGGGHRHARARVADHDAAESRFEIGQRSGEAEYRHHFRGHRDIEAVFTGITIGGTAQADHDVPQCAVVQVQRALPGDEARVDVQRIAVVDVVIEHRRQQIVGGADGMEVAGEMQIDVFHRHHLRIAAAGRTALDAEAGAERGLTQADDGAPPAFIQGIAETDGGGGLAFAGWRRADGGHQHQLAVGA